LTNWLAGLDKSLLPALATNGAANWAAGFGQALPVEPDRLVSSGWRPLSTLFDLLAYGAVAGLAHAVQFYRRYRERERRALALETTLAQARLRALQAQLQPHFLFNTLNAIATLLRRDPRAAEATLTALSDLLRAALRQPEQPEATVREELHFVERYVEIMQTRFGERLRFEQAIAPETLDCLVPTLLLQPLVENAIRHGIEPAEHGGLVRVTAQRQGESLVLTIEDDGVGLASSHSSMPSLLEQGAAARPGNGIGLANLRARLEALYGARQSLVLAARPGGGTVVRVELPWHPATEVAPLLGDEKGGP
jgi:sensor histidine kinase YesM